MKGILTLSLICFFFFTSGFAQDLSVLTYNLRYDTQADGENRWDNRKDFLIAQLRFYRPDVFGTQEGMVHQLKAIEAGLGDYGFVGKGRDKGTDEGEFSAIFYNKYRVNLLSDSTFWLSETPDVPSKGWDAALNRVCTYALFEERGDGKMFYVFNAHLDHMGERARKESLRLIRERIAEVNTTGFPVVLMGDFNLEPGHEAVIDLGKVMTDAHLLAGKEAFGPGGTFNGFETASRAERRIDYLFLSPNDFRLKKYGILTATVEGRFPSDHFPVYAELEWNP